MNVLVVLNEQHKLLAEQEKILNKQYFNNWGIYSVPANGWTLEEQKEHLKKLAEADVVVFASPIPFLLKELAKRGKPEILVFHNDKREKKELPGGKIVFTVAEEGWELV